MGIRPYAVSWGETDVSGKVTFIIIVTVLLPTSVTGISGTRKRQCTTASMKYRLESCTIRSAPCVHLGGVWDMAAGY